MYPGNVRRALLQRWGRGGSQCSQGTQVFLPPFPSLPRLHSASRIIAGELSCWEAQEQDVKKSQELYKLSPAVLPEQPPHFCLLHGSAWLQAPPTLAAAQPQRPSQASWSVGSWATHCQHTLAASFLILSGVHTPELDNLPEVPGESGLSFPFGRTQLVCGRKTLLIIITHQ